MYRSLIGGAPTQYERNGLSIMAALEIGWVAPMWPYRDEQAGGAQFPKQGVVFTHHTQVAR